MIESKPEVESHGERALTFHDLPADIARLIVSIAVHGATALTLVSKTIQHWVDPFFFRHMEFHSPENLNAYIDTLNELPPSNRLLRIRPYVWSICIDSSFGETVPFMQLLALHPSLRSLYLCDTLPPLSIEGLSAAPSMLTHLSASFDHVIDLSIPYFAGLTHLDISDFDLLNKRLPDMSALSHLQVIVMGGEDAGYRGFRDALAVLPAHLETIIWFVNLKSICSFLSLDDATTDIVTGTTDARIVVCLAEVEDSDGHAGISPYIIVADLLSEPFEFFNWRSEGTTLWERAGSVKRRRLENANRKALKL
ncbi:hypothetical protein DL96DRAFT_1628628 [Flagelloscypha sp. PMI_526]|nr:hypothetical protein DL96DRAFT_1628628 [Flagelloscypha sp. PMI_526]